MSIQSNFPAIDPSLMLDFANTKQLDNRITFTRSTPAVYYDGKTTAKAEENLTTNSNTVGGTNWTIYAGLTIATNNATAPDGTTTATLLTASSATKQSVYQTRTAVTVIYTLSIYAKAGTNSWIAFDDGSGGTSAWFNVSAGTIGTVTGGTATITSVGNGWYRCTYTSSSASLFTTINGISVPNANNTQSQTIGNTVYVWGAQSELRTSATAYTATTTQAITNYIPVLLSAGGNQARFDCNPTTGESLGLLIEESRTNLITYSEQFDNAAWIKNSVTVTANQVVAPDGTLTADLCTTSAANSLISRAITISADTATYTQSIYIRWISGSTNMFVRAALTGGTSVAKFLTINALTGVFVSGDAAYTITSVGNNWYRLSISITNNGTNTTYNLQNYTTADTVNTNSLALWGSQLEAGSFATSYIATTSASATRTADAASMTGTNFSSWYNQAQGTIYADATTYMDVTNTANRTDTVTISEGTASTNSMLLGVNTVGSANVMYLYTLANGSPQVDLQLTLTSGSYKTSYAYKVNDFALCLNGSSASTDGSGILSYAVNQMWIGSRFNSGQHQNGTIKKIAYYPIRVTNAQLQALTS